MTDEMVAWMEEAKFSHDAWAEWLDANPDQAQVADPRPRNDSLGNAEEHREWSRRYAAIISALRKVA